MTLGIISGVLALPLIAIASFGEIDALGPWDHGELECTTIKYRARAIITRS